MAKANQILGAVTVVAKTASLWCASLNFTQEASVLTVLEAGVAPKKPTEITPAQLSDLQASPYLVVMEGEGKQVGPDLSAELSATREQLSNVTAERDAALAQLKALQPA
jgi:hypothetical protein